LQQQLPVPPNAKVDRRALPAPTRAEVDLSESVKEPEDALEMQLRIVFEKFFQRRPIGVDMSFFELGGDSLQALKLIVEIERVTGKQLPLGTLYQYSTMEALAEVLQKQSGGPAWSALVRLQPRGHRPPFFLIHTTPGD